LVDAVTLLPTPGARLGDERRGMPSAALAERRYSSGRRNLEDGIALLPTPAARDYKSGRSNVMDRNARPLNEVAVMLLLPTPRATDGRSGSPNQRDRKGHLGLPGVAYRIEE
jgi:DNA (cytosine-5)-methyltransferase 1